MNNDVTRGLSLLADEAEPVLIDSHDVVAKARARTRNRRATTATALATVAVVGALTVALGGWPARQGTTAGTESTTIAPDLVDDGRAARFTEQFAAVWPTIVPAGVTTESSQAAVQELGSRLDPLEFVAHRLGLGFVEYSAVAKLSDAAGTTELRIDIWPPNEQFSELDPCPPCSSHHLQDGTEARVQRGLITSDSLAERTYLTALRPDGSRIQVMEMNATYGSTDVSRPDLVLDTDALLALATAFTY